MENASENNSVVITRFFSMYILIPAALFLFFTLIFTLFKLDYIDFGIPFAGPIGRPRFENMRWNSIEMAYWVILEKDGKQEELKRNVFLSKEQSGQIRECFRTNQSRGWALGNPYDSKLKTTNRDFYFRFSSPNTLNFSRVSDTDYGYRVELKNNEFYESIKELCLENEKKVFPNAQYDNIRVCGNHSNEKVKPILINGEGEIEAEKARFDEIHKLHP